MQYYEVLVASQRYHGDGALTYGYGDQLLPGTVVVAPLQNQKIPGVVIREVLKPTFKTRSILTVLDNPALPEELLKLIGWLKEYYPAPLGQLMTLLLPTSLVQKSRKSNVVHKTGSRKKLPSLTAEQKRVVEDISSSSQRMHLLHGETGTGKTRVYQELIKQNKQQNKNTLLLTPEIGLTSQLSQDIENSFPGHTVILHSNLSPAEKRNRWNLIASSSEPLIVIGPRSALFAPLKNVGLIILDEAHDNAYKQEQSPYYQATRVAAKLAELHNAKAILGTATPLISDYYTFIQKKLPIHRMKALAVKNNYSTNVQMINMRESTNFTRSKWISNQVLDAIKDNLALGNQSLLFLNRRGSARIILCQNCGWSAVCPKCDVALTFHADSHSIHCHTCGYKTAAPTSCPECHAAEITFRSAGTKAVASEMEHLFPEAKIIRLDGDNLKSERLENVYQSLKSGEANIVVGTQVISKGLDLPKLGFVAVILADTGLNFPDYSAEERTYQLLSQVLGRINRGHRDTRAIIQTFNPDNPTIVLAATKDYERFYEIQRKERERFGFPPFKYLLKIEVERASSKSAEAAAQKIASSLRQKAKGLEVSDATPAFIEKISNRYRWHIIVKSSHRTVLTDIIQQLPANTTYDIDPVNLL